MKEEIAVLKRNPTFVGGILDAIIHANSTTGYAGEQAATELLKNRYCEMFSYNLPGLGTLDQAH